MCIYIYIIHIYTYMGPLMVLGGGAFSYERGITVHRKRPRRSLRSNTSLTKRSCSSKHGIPLSDSSWLIRVFPGTNRVRLGSRPSTNLVQVRQYMYLNSRPDSGHRLKKCSAFTRDWWRPESGLGLGRTALECLSDKTELLLALRTPFLYTYLYIHIFINMNIDTYLLIYRYVDMYI